MDTRWPALALAVFVMGVLAVIGIFWLQAHKVESDSHTTVQDKNNSQDKND